MNVKTSAVRTQQTSQPTTPPQGFKAFFDSTSGSFNSIKRTFGPRLVIPEIPKEDSKVMFGKMPTVPKSRQVQLVENLERRMIHDLEDVTPYEELNLAFIYNDLMPGDVISPISLKRVKEFLENIVKPASESGYEKVKAYYNVLAEDIPKNKLEKLRNAAQTFLGTFRTIENALLYSQGFYEMALRMAPKLDAPEDMSLADRIKWLRLWVFIIRDQTLFWGDMDVKGNLYGKSHLKSFNQLHIYPETLMFAEREYFSKLPDNSILYNMLIRMMGLFSQDVQNTILRYGEIGCNVADSSGKIEYVRNFVKKKMFPHPWLAQSAYFCMPVGIKTFSPERLRHAVEAYKNGGVETLPTFEYAYVDAYNDYKRRKMTCYQYSTAVVKGEERKVGVTCKEELALYVELYKWLLEHPDFKFGPEEKTLAEYEMDTLLEETVDPKTLVLQWILEMGFAKDEADVNLELAEVILMPEENIELFEMYQNGEIPGRDIFERFKFASDAQAIACFSKISRISINEQDKMGQALKRLKNFGVKSALPSDLIYLEIFKYFAKNSPEMLGKGMVNMYGPKFCQ